MLSSTVTQWFAEHAMGPQFMLSELAKETGLKYEVLLGISEHHVKFDANGSEHPIAKELDGKTLVVGTWKEVEEPVIRKTIMKKQDIT